MEFTAGVLKFFLNFLGGFLLMIGSAIEPSIGVWVISIGGSLLTSSLGREDKTMRMVFIHVIIGIFWGIFASQIIHSMYINIPQVAIAFFAAMFGVEATWYFIRNFRQGSMTTFLIEVFTSFLSNIIPWMKKK